MNRSILVSLVIIGTIAALAGGSTLALFSDTEQSNDNTFATGALDLKIDYQESYNGEVVENQSLTDDPGAIFNLSDVKPGDMGEATISFHVFDNPAYVNMSLNQTANDEISCTEPEAEAEGGDCGTEGELGENLELLIWYDDGDNERQQDEEVIFNGTAEELEQAGLPEGVALDADPSTPEIEPYENSTTRYVGVRWKLPMDVGNEVQTDEKKFDFEFYAEQARHNSNTNGNNTNGNTGEPQTEDAYYQTDLAEGPVIHNLSQQTYNSRDYDNDGGGDMAAWMHGGPGIPMDNESVRHYQGNCVDPGNDASDVFMVDTSADTVQADFNVTSDDCQVTLVSYVKPYAGWIADRADEQIVFDNETTTLDSGQHSLTVDIPNSN